VRTNFVDIVGIAVKQPLLPTNKIYYLKYVFLGQARQTCLF